MNVLDPKRRAAIVTCLADGNSIRATCRMTGAAKGTVLKLLADLGEVCLAYHDQHVRGLKSRRVQCDEIWAFAGAEDKNLTEDERAAGRGSIWTWTALDADSKLIVSFQVGTHAECAYEFMQDVASRLATRVQTTTDGHKAGVNAVTDAFDDKNDCATLVMLRGETPAGAGRYSPAPCIGAQPVPITDELQTEHVSTSSGQTLTMQMPMRRFTRLTNGFSKKAGNLAHALAVQFMHYNFVRMHQTLRCTPAMAAGIADRVWSLADLIALIPEPERAAWGSKKRTRFRRH